MEKLYFKADREAFWNDVETSQALRSFHEREPGKACDWLGIKPAAAKVAAANGTEFTYGPNEKPSVEFLELILTDLKELGVEIKLNPITGESALSGNVASISSALLASIRRHKKHLLDLIITSKPIRVRLSTEAEYPLPEEPVEWDNMLENLFGRCLGKYMNPLWQRWRYLYGPTRNTWHHRDGWQETYCTYDEPDEPDGKGKGSIRYWIRPAKPEITYARSKFDGPDEIPD